MSDWIREIELLYGANTACQFLLHGNVRDLFWLPPPPAPKPAAPPPPAAADAATGGLNPAALAVSHASAATAPAAAPATPASSAAGELLDLDDFLSRRLLGSFTVVIKFDLAHGIEVVRGRESLQGWEHLGVIKDLRDSPKEYLALLRQLFLFLNNRAVAERKPVHVAAIFADAHLLVPAEANNLYFDLSACASLIRDWSRPREHAWFSLTTFLIAENLSDLHPILRTNPLAAPVAVPLPTEADLAAELSRQREPFYAALGLFVDKPAVLAKRLRGLTRYALLGLLRRHAHLQTPLDDASVAVLRKQAVERESAGLIEFVETSLTLADYQGQPQLVEAVRTDLKLFREGVTRAVPMGYLVAGPVGTGKTYLVNCIAGEAGVPVVVLKNFRDRWVGSSEANLERIFRLIDALGQCVVFVDEADQTLGRRTGADSSSDVNGRLYSMLAQFMGNGANRGRVIWMLATSRPDLIEVDLKRPGRIDRRLPVLPATSPDDAWVMLRGIFARNQLVLPETRPPELELPELLTAGAATSIATAVYRQEFLTKRTALELLTEHLAAYVPPVPVSRIQEQIRLALEDTSDLSLLPPALRVKLMGSAATESR